MEVEHVMEEESVESNLAQSLVEKHGFFDPKLELSKYRFPTHELLVEQCSYITQCACICILPGHMQEKMQKKITF